MTYNNLIKNKLINIRKYIKIEYFILEGNIDLVVRDEYFIILHFPLQEYRI